MMITKFNKNILGVVIMFVAIAFVVFSVFDEHASAAPPWSFGASVYENECEDAFVCACDGALDVAFGWYAVCPSGMYIQWGGVVFGGDGRPDVSSAGCESPDVAGSVFAPLNLRVQCYAVK